MAIVLPLASPWKDKGKRNAWIVGTTVGERVGDDPLVLATNQALGTTRAVHRGRRRGHGMIGAPVGVQGTHELSLYFHV